jgi:hypothetical protein
MGAPSRPPLTGVPAFISEIDHLNRPANLAAEAGGLIQVADRP